MKNTRGTRFWGSRGRPGPNSGILGWGGGGPMYAIVYPAFLRSSVAFWAEPWADEGLLQGVPSGLHMRPPSSSDGRARAGHRAGATGAEMASSSSVGATDRKRARLSAPRLASSGLGMGTELERASAPAFDDLEELAKK